MTSAQPSGLPLPSAITQLTDLAIVASDRPHSVAPQVRPPPKAARRTRSPGFTRPSSIAVASAIGIEAAEVLP